MKRKCHAIKVLKHTNNQNGSALITAVLILMVVTVLGIVATKTSTIELRIAAQDKFHKMTWFATDATVDAVVPGLLEQAIDNRLQAGDNLEEILPVFSSSLTANNFEFYNNRETGICALDTPSPTNADLVLDADAMGESSVFVRAYGPTQAVGGTSQLMVEGYSGFGKSAARGGTMIVYSIRGLGVGNTSNSEARIESRWRYVIN